MSLCFGLLMAPIGVFQYLWTFGFSLGPLTTEQLTVYGGQLVRDMLVTAIFTVFPMWLALEKFERPDRRRKETQLSTPVDAQQIVGRERRERVSHHDWCGDG